MDVYLKEMETEKIVRAEILPASKKDMPAKKEGWNFDWKKLFQQKYAHFFKINLQKSPNKIEGLLKLSIQPPGIIFMDDVEIAPQNLGKSGKYDFVAGCLIAFACDFSHQFGSENYAGFLNFISKTALIEFYQKRYGATQLVGNRMFIDPIMGNKLIQQYLAIKFDKE